MRAAFASLLLLVACGTTPKDPNHASKSFSGGSGASDDRTAFAYIDDGENLVVITASGTRRVKRPACMDRPRVLLVAPGGLAVAAYGAHHAAGDLWGHGGKQISANCVLDLATGATEEISEPTLPLWFGTRLVEVTERPLAAGTCATATATTGPLAVCVEGATLAVRRYQGASLAHDPDARWPLAAAFDRPQIRIAPDGQRVAVWDARSLVVIDLARGAAVMTFTDLGRLETVELDPAGRDRIMLVGAPYEAGTSPDPRLRIVGFDGRLIEERHEPGADRVVHWMDAQTYWSTNTSGVDRRRLADGR